MTDQTHNIPKGWKITTLGEVVKIGRGSSPRPIQDFIVEKNGIPCVKIADATASSNRLQVIDILKEQKNL